MQFHQALLRWAMTSVAWLALASAAIVACGGVVDPRYPPRDAACAVRFYAERPDVPIDELGTVGILCPSCTQQLKAQICERGGDVAWGFGHAYALSSGGGRPTVRLPPQVAIGHTRVVSQGETNGSPP